MHSMKDMPTALPEGLQISSMLKRHNPADVLISEQYDSFAALPQSAKVGTSSLRRRRSFYTNVPIWRFMICGEIYRLVCGK